MRKRFFPSITNPLGDSKLRFVGLVPGNMFRAGPFKSHSNPLMQGGKCGRVRLDESLWDAMMRWWWDKVHVDRSGNDNTPLRLRGKELSVMAN